MKKFKNYFQGRVVGFGTYDLQRPDNTSHWVALTGKNREDHMMLYEKMQNNSEFTKLIAERGNRVAVKDYVAEILRIYKLNKQFKSFYQNLEWGDSKSFLFNFLNI